MNDNKYLRLVPEHPQSNAASSFETETLALEKLDRAVSEFLDANSAWENDEIGQDSYLKTINALKIQMYETRAILKRPT